MANVRTMKIVFVLFILVFVTNTILASSARANLRSFAKTAHTGKKMASGLFSDDPDQNSDFKIASCDIHHHVKKQYNSVSAMLNVCSVLISLSYTSIIPINTSQPYSNTISDIHIPPK